MKLKDTEKSQIIELIKSGSALPKEIIKIHNNKDDTLAGSVVEKWTGNFLFENEWQSFRTKKDKDQRLHFRYPRK